MKRLSLHRSDRMSVSDEDIVEKTLENQGDPKRIFRISYITFNRMSFGSKRWGCSGRDRP